MDVKIEESWKVRLQTEFEKPYFKTLTDFVRNEYQQTTIFPPGKFIFNAFNLCPFHQVKVVIMSIKTCKGKQNFAYEQIFAYFLAYVRILY